MIAHVCACCEVVLNFLVCFCVRVCVCVCVYGCLWPILARAHLGPDPFGPGPIWARAHLGPAHLGPGPGLARATNNSDKELIV